MKKNSLKPNLNVKKSRNQVFPALMELAVPWTAFVEGMTPNCASENPGGLAGSPQTTLKFVNRLLKHEWAEQILPVTNVIHIGHGILYKPGTVVNARLFAPHPESNNKDHMCAPEMLSGRQGLQMRFSTDALTVAAAKPWLAASSASLGRHNLLEALIHIFLGELANFPKLICKLIHIKSAGWGQPMLRRSWS